MIATTVALATPPSGQHTTPPVTGTLQPVDSEPGGVEFETRTPMEVTTSTLTLDPGGFTGWHIHPGVLIATVQAGTVVGEVAGESRTYSVGESFVVHGDEPTGQVRNPSVAQPASVSVTQIAPAGTPRRTASDPPRCTASGARGASRHRGR